MSGLSIGIDRASRGILPSLPALCNARENNALRAQPLILVDRFLEALAGGERRDGLGGDLDLLAVHRAAPGARLARARQEGAEADQRDALAFRDVLDDLLEYRVHHFSCGRFADVSGLRRDLDQIGLGDHVWHALSP